MALGSTAKSIQRYEGTMKITRSQFLEFDDDTLDAPLAASHKADETFDHFAGTIIDGRGNVGRMSPGGVSVLNSRVS
jgi:hypothetical protein